MTKPMVEPDADAEAILWDVSVSDEDTGGDYQTVLHHYLKIKIFNERGREAFSKMDIPFGKIDGIGVDIRIKDIAARTTKADGTTVELKSSDVFDRDVVKASGVRLKAKSFAVPGIEPGAVIEYRWKEIRGGVSLNQRLQFAREIPVELVRYHIRPVPHPELGMSGQPFNSKNDAFAKEKDGFYVTSAHNVPAFKEEPRMPPEYSVRPWLLLYYTKESKPDPEKFWKEYSKGEYDVHKGLMKVSDEVKAAAATAVGSETDEEKKVEKIFNYVRSNIRNVFDDALNLSADDLKKLKENKSPADTLKRGQGNSHDIAMAFAAMTTAAGLETRVANLPERSNIFFPKWFLNDYFISTENIAVKIGGKWRYFDPQSRYVPFGMLRWAEEGVPALVSDPKEPVWETTPMSLPSRSMEKRTGKFKLSEDGTLTGSIRMEFTGHTGAELKEYNDDDTPQQREETLKRMVRENLLGTAEITDISIENVTDPDKPFVYQYNVRVPGYATKTGKRIFVQPGVFERSTKPVFESSERRYDIYFNYPYSEHDELSIELPAGFELESPDAPAPVKENSGIGVDDIKIMVSTDKRFVLYVRDFSFGNGGALKFDKQVYPALKGLFDSFYKANQHVLTLRQVAAK